LGCMSPPSDLEAKPLHFLTGIHFNEKLDETLMWLRFEHRLPLRTGQGFGAPRLSPGEHVAIRARELPESDRPNSRIRSIQCT